jgi:CO/xanthine dehydrogenase Mo-binding subunit
VAVEIELLRQSGVVRVRRVVAAVDTGQVVNPDGGPAGAAIANAIRDATGVRLHDLPFTSARIKKAIGDWKG